MWSFQGAGFGALGVCMWYTDWKGSYLNDLICALRADSEALCYHFPLRPPSRGVPLLCISTLFFLFTRLLCFVSFLWDKESDSNGSQDSSWPCVSAPDWLLFKKNYYYYYHHGSITPSLTRSPYFANSPMKYITVMKGNTFFVVIHLFSLLLFALL